MNHCYIMVGAVLAAAAIISVMVWSHSVASARLYGSTLRAHSNGSDLALLTGGTVQLDGNGEANSNFLIDLGREGARYCHMYNIETMLLSALLLVIAFAMTAYKTYSGSS